MIPGGALTAAKLPLPAFLPLLDGNDIQHLLSIAPNPIADNTLTVVFLDFTGANAMATAFDFDAILGPLPAGTVGNRFFIFMTISRLDRRDITLAHEVVSRVVQPPPCSGSGSRQSIFHL